MTEKKQSNPAAIGLIDCNNFYVSSERVFNPKLRNKPVVVLSNNDGCAISRSNEAKSIIPMGAPIFQFEKELEKAGAEIYSSNYELYGDMSERVMKSFYEWTPEVEVYSIDEAFLGLEETQKSFDYLGKEIQDKIYKYTGIPVGIGIAETKTLAKIANKIAKKSEKAKGVLDLYKSKWQDAALGRTAIGDVWGIGPASVKKLEAVNIKTALGFKNADLAWIKKNFTVVGGRTLLELRGVRCLPLELEPPPKESITCSRSFSEPVTDYNPLKMAMSCYLMNAVDKMRKHNLAARSVTVFVSTNKFLPGEVYSNSFVYKSAYPSDNLFEIQSWAHKAFDEVFREHKIYKKCGVILGGLMPKESRTARLYEEVNSKHEKLNKAIDEINKKFGKNTIHLAVATAGKWQMKREKLSPRYTTRFKEILEIGENAGKHNAAFEQPDKESVETAWAQYYAEKGIK